MKILHVIPAMTWDRGGPAGVVAALARHQQALGHEVSVLTTNQGARHGERPIELPPQVELVAVPVFGPDRIAYAPKFARTVAEQLDRADAMHVHSIFRHPCLTAVKVAAQRHRKVIIRPCGVLHRYGLESRSAIIKGWFLRRHGRMYLETCGGWHYTSENERQESWPFANVEGFVLPNGIDADAYAIDRTAARLTIQETFPETGSGRYALFLGRLHRKKRVDLLLQAFLAGAPSDTRLVVAGPDEDRLWPELERTYLQDEKQKQRVVRIGLVTGETKHQLLAGASLFALSSEHENFGNAVLEALAAGTPVLGSDKVDLVRELARHDLAEVAPLDEETWKEMLRERLSEPVGTQFVSRAREYIASEYGWSSVAERLVAEYRTLAT